MSTMFTKATAFKPVTIQGWNTQQMSSERLQEMFCEVPACRPTWYPGDTCSPNPGVCLNTTTSSTEPGMHHRCSVPVDAERHRRIKALGYKIAPCSA